jgi:hypothetical protein
MSDDDASNDEASDDGQFVGEVVNDDAESTIETDIAGKAFFDALLEKTKHVSVLFGRTKDEDDVRLVYLNTTATEDNAPFVLRVQCVSWFYNAVNTLKNFMQTVSSLKVAIQTVLAVVLTTNAISAYNTISTFVSSVPWVTAALNSATPLFFTAASTTSTALLSFGSAITVPHALLAAGVVVLLLRFFRATPSLPNIKSKLAAYGLAAVTAIKTLHPQALTRNAISVFVNYAKQHGRDYTPLVPIPGTYPQSLPTTAMHLPFVVPHWLGYMLQTKLVPVQNENKAKKFEKVLDMAKTYQDTNLDIYPYRNASDTIKSLIFPLIAHAFVDLDEKQILFVKTVVFKDKNTAVFLNVGDKQKIKTAEKYTQLFDAEQREIPHIQQAINDLYCPLKCLYAHDMQVQKLKNTTTRTAINWAIYAGQTAIACLNATNAVVNYINVTNVATSNTPTQTLHNVLTGLTALTFFVQACTAPNLQTTQKIKNLTVHSYNLPGANFSRDFNAFGALKIRNKIHLTYAVDDRFVGLDGFYKTIPPPELPTTPSTPKQTPKQQQQQQEQTKSGPPLGEFPTGPFPKGFVVMGNVTIGTLNVNTGTGGNSRSSQPTTRTQEQTRASTSTRAGTSTRPQTSARATQTPIVEEPEDKSHSSDDTLNATNDDDIQRAEPRRLTNTTPRLAISFPEHKPAVTQVIVTKTLANVITKLKEKLDELKKFRLPEPAMNEDAELTASCVPVETLNTLKVQTEQYVNALNQIRTTLQEYSTKRDAAIEKKKTTEPANPEYVAKQDATTNMLNSLHQNLDNLMLRLNILNVIFEQAIKNAQESPVTVHKEYKIVTLTQDINDVAQYVPNISKKNT